MKKVYLIYGSPCSGKTTYARELAKPNDLIIDFDSILYSISGCKMFQYCKATGDIAHKVRDLLINLVKDREGNWENAYIVSCYPFEKERLKVAEELNAELIRMNTTEEECIKRLKENPNGRNIKNWEIYIKDWFRQNGGAKNAN
jgi:predicted kinase